jgi:hypothetical protein
LSWRTPAFSEALRFLHKHHLSNALESLALDLATSRRSARGRFQVPYRCRSREPAHVAVAHHCLRSAPYREHPEAKFLGHDGKPCDSHTRGLLRRGHIVANRHRYIGKETSRRWEQGDDLSMVDFVCAEYSDGKTGAEQELRERIVEFGIRKTARATKIDSKTIMLIAGGERVKPSTLAKVREFFNRQES